MSDKENSAPKKSRFRTARGWVAFACVAFALAGMAFRVGIGTPSAFGIQQISAICPLGALETMAGAKSVMLHPLLLFALVVVLIALVGKALDVPRSVVAEVLPPEKTQRGERRRRARRLGEERGGA